MQIIGWRCRKFSPGPGLCGCTGWGTSRRERTEASDGTYGRSAAEGRGHLWCARPRRYAIRSIGVVDGDSAHRCLFLLRGTGDWCVVGLRWDLGGSGLVVGGGGPLDCDWSGRSGRRRIRRLDLVASPTPRLFVEGDDGVATRDAFVVSASAKERRGKGETLWKRALTV